VAVFAGLLLQPGSEIVDGLEVLLELALLLLPDGVHLNKTVYCLAASLLHQLFAGDVSSKNLSHGLHELLVTVSSLLQPVDCPAQLVALLFALQIQLEGSVEHHQPHVLHNALELVSEGLRAHRLNDRSLRSVVARLERNHHQLFGGLVVEGTVGTWRRPILRVQVEVRANAEDGWPHLRQPFGEVLTLFLSQQKFGEARHLQLQFGMLTVGFELKPSKVLALPNVHCISNDRHL